LSIPSFCPADKARFYRLRPVKQEGLQIQYLLKTKDIDFTNVATRLGITNVIVFNVVFGHRRSARVEAEIARILGKADWNEVVLEARSAVTGKPIQAIVEEIQARLEARRKASAERFAGAMADALAAAKSGARRAG
jgi:hypothetical protein